MSFFNNLFFADTSVDGTLRVIGIKRAGLAIVNTLDGDIRLKVLTGSQKGVVEQAKSFAGWANLQAIAGLPDRRLESIRDEIKVSIALMGMYTPSHAVAQINTARLLMGDIQRELDYRRQNGVGHLWC